MIRTWNESLLPFLLIVVYMTVSASGLHARAQGSHELAKKVAALSEANWRAIQTVEYRYVYRTGNIERLCAYAREVEKYYHASVDLYKNGGRGLPREVTWDGRVARSRPSPHMFNRSTDRRDAKPSCPTPESAIEKYMLFNAIFGKSSSYAFKEARNVTVDGQQLVELEFISKRDAARAITRHSKALRLLPVWCQYIDHVGRVTEEMPLIEYVRREIDGNVVYYPVHVVQKTYRDGKLTDVETFEVDGQTLRLNLPIEEKRFHLEPWPSDGVVDLNTFKELAPRDADWSPVGKVGFPYDVFYENVKPDDARYKRPAYVGPAATPGPARSEGSTASSSAPVTSLVNRPFVASSWALLLSLGLLLIIGSVVWRFCVRRARV